jgi:hypothetical protein
LSAPLRQSRKGAEGYAKFCAGAERGPEPLFMTTRLVVVMRDAGNLGSQDG